MIDLYCNAIASASPRRSTAVVELITDPEFAGWRTDVEDDPLPEIADVAVYSVPGAAVNGYPLTGSGKIQRGRRPPGVGRGEHAGHELGG